MKFVDMTPEFLNRARTEVEKAIARSTIRVEREASRLVNQHAGPTKMNPDRPASQPGEPPHKRTGTLARSLDSETYRKGGQFFGRMGTNLLYGRFLELGTQRMAPRPYLRPALDVNRKRIVEDIKQAGRRMGRA